LWSGGRFEPMLETWLEPVTQFTKLSLIGERAFYENHALEAGFMLLSIGVATFGWWAAKSLYFDLALTEARLARLRGNYRGVPGARAARLPRALAPARGHSGGDRFPGERGHRRIDARQQGQCPARRLDREGRRGRRRLQGQRRPPDPAPGRHRQGVGHLHQAV